ncbi:hypothetical protein ACFYXM_11100 [Streptomyces sp. NPDC002476]|uniref:hypothetical protein n=1 Tax=Streptomyces sp. NPDC002476 TaxID=3364648 RepID=UPI00369E8ECD
MTNETTQQAITFLQWHRGGYLVATAQFPAGYSQRLITDYRLRVAEKGGTTIEVYDPNQT